MTVSVRTVLWKMLGTPWQPHTHTRGPHGAHSPRGPLPHDLPPRTIHTPACRHHAASSPRDCLARRPHKACQSPSAPARDSLATTLSQDSPLPPESASPQAGLPRVLSLSLADIGGQSSAVRAPCASQMFGSGAGLCPLEAIPYILPHSSCLWKLPNTQDVNPPR